LQTDAVNSQHSVRTDQSNLMLQFISITNDLRTSSNCKTSNTQTCLLANPAR